MLKLMLGVLLCGVVSLTPVAARTGRTQIVVQWLSSESHLSPWQIFKIQGVFDDRADKIGYDSDGNDIGSGTENYYLYADDGKIDAVVQGVITMQKEKVLPGGMRIGVAVYKDANRRDWSYRAVYPKSLTEFDITYSRSRNIEH
jgi:hypothetical protein